jgi:intein/homing endonuclease
LSSGGEYRKTVWKSFGKQKIYKLMLENGDELHATKEHEWVVNHNSRVRDGFKRVYTIDMKNKRIPLQGVKNFCYDDEKWM